MSASVDWKVLQEHLDRKVIKEVREFLVCLVSRVLLVDRVTLAVRVNLGLRDSLEPLALLVRKVLREHLDQMDREDLLVILVWLEVLDPWDKLATKVLPD